MAGEPGNLNPSERAELERLRAEVSARAEHQQPGKRHVAWIPRVRWRSVVSAALITLGCVLAPVSVLAVWTANQVSDTNRYVANVEPLIRQPPIRNALTNDVSSAISNQLAVQSRLNAAAADLSSHNLPRLATLLHTFSGQIADGVNGFIHSQVARVIASPHTVTLWTQVNRAGHAMLVKALSGQGSKSVKIVNNEVTISLGPFITEAKHNLAARGLTIVNKLPPIDPTFTLFSATNLVKAQSLYRLLVAAKYLVPLLALVLIAIGIYAARRRRRALIAATLGVAASMLALAAVLAIVRSIYLNSVPSSALPADAAAAAYDTLVRFIKDGLRLLAVLGLIVAGGAFFAGPSVTASRTRQGITKGIVWIRKTAEGAGLRTGPVGRWAGAHKTGLRISAVAVVSLIFVFWGRPTVVVAVVLALVLLVLLALIELVGGRSRAAPEVAATAPGAEPDVAPGAESDVAVPGSPGEPRSVGSRGARRAADHS